MLSVREIAIAKGLKFYEGVCRKHGECERSCVNGKCRECRREKSEDRRLPATKQSRSYIPKKRGLDDVMPRKSRKFDWSSVKFEDEPNNIVKGEYYVPNLRHIVTRSDGYLP